MDDKEIEEEVRKEAEQFGDICRVSLVESYQGLLHKVTKPLLLSESFQGLVNKDIKPLSLLEKCQKKFHGDHFHLCRANNGWSRIL